MFGKRVPFKYLHRQEVTIPALLQDTRTCVGEDRLSELLDLYEGVCKIIILSYLNQRFQVTASTLNSCV